MKIISPCLSKAGTSVDVDSGIESTFVTGICLETNNLFLEKW